MHRPRAAPGGSWSHSDPKSLVKAVQRVPTARAGTAGAADTESVVEHDVKLSIPSEEAKRELWWVV